MGHLARQKATNPRVMSFGVMMIKDHSAANGRLQAIAAVNNINVPRSLGVSGMASKTKLKILAGESFDKSYIKDMIRDNQEALAMFQKESTSGQDADAVAFASANLPMLQAHLAAIESIAQANGINID
jgi:putative membrane protein